MSKIFISYANENKGFIEKLSRDLIKKGYGVVYDFLIDSGASWANSLYQAIENTDFLLVILTPDYLESFWALEEMKIGLLLEHSNKIKVIPILLEKCQPPPLLTDKIYLDFNLSYSDGLQDLINHLKELETVEKNPGESVVLSENLGVTEFHKLRDELLNAVETFKALPDQFDSKTVNERKGGKEKRRCFVVMPFNDCDLEIVYDDFLKPVIENECNLICERGDDVFGSNVIMDDIHRSINRASIIIADLTRKNANVFYEVGICHTLSKQVLLIAQTIDDVPFDLRHRRVLLYEYSPRGCKRLEKALKENIISMMSSQ